MKAGTAGGFPDKRGDTEKVYGTMNSCPRVSRFRDGGERKMKRNGMKTGWMLTAMFALVLVLTLAFGLTGPGAAAETITYIDDDGDTVSADAEILTSSTVTLVRGVYTANKNLTINRRVTVSGSVTIVLKDGVTLKIPKGITVLKGNKLTICGQEKNTGKLIINKPRDYFAGIGGINDKMLGQIIIAGGNIDVKGGQYAAGIGSGYRGKKGGKVTIKGGSVNAESGEGASYGIGCGRKGKKLSSVTITGGQITTNGIASNNIKLNMTDEDGYIWNKGEYFTDYNSVFVEGVLRVADSGEMISVAVSGSAINGKKLVGDSLTVTFDSKGGSAVEKQSVKYGETASEPSAPTRKNATFVEWRLNGSGWSFDKPVTESITLTAVWRFDDFISVSADSDFSDQRGQDGSYVLVDGVNYRLEQDVTTSGYLSVPKGASVIIDLNGHTINRGLTSATANGYVLKVAGDLILEDNGTGGKITGGYEENKGGGIWLSGNLTMSGGTISGNHAARGAGVYIASGTFNMNGGTISGNYAEKYGGGVYVYSAGTFRMSSGEITGNRVGTGSGGGIYKMGSAYFSGSPSVTDNKCKGNPYDMYLSVLRPKIFFDGPLSADARIGVHMEKHPGEFTVGMAGNARTDNFISNQNYIIHLSENGEAMLEDDAVRISFDPDGGGNEMADVFISSGSSYTLPDCDFTEPSGKVFDGWTIRGSEADGNSERYKPGEEITVSEDTVLKALWRDSVWTVTFNMNGHGTQIGSQTVEDQTCATEPAAPEAEGLVFEYWVLQEDGETENYDPEGAETEGAGTQSQEPGEEPGDEEPGDEEPDGNPEDEAEIPYDFSDPVTENITLVARWSIPVTAEETEAEVTGEYTWTGEQIIPEVNVTVNGTAVDPGEYTVTARNTLQAGEEAIAIINDRPGGKYRLEEKRVYFTILRMPVVVSGITAKNKVCDGTDTAMFDVSGVTFNGEKSVGGVTVEVTGAFADALPGENKTVTITGIEISGENAGNYELAKSGSQTTTAAAILPPHTVSFVDENGTAFTGVPDQTVNNGEKAERPQPDPAREGCVFLEWMNGGTPFDFDAPLDSENSLTLTLTPRYATAVTLYPNGNYLTVNGQTGAEAIASFEGARVTVSAPEQEPGAGNGEVLSGYLIYYLVPQEGDSVRSVNIEYTLNENGQAVFTVPELPVEAGQSIIISAEYIMPDNLVDALRDPDNEHLLHVRNAADFALVRNWVNGSHNMAGDTVQLECNLSNVGGGFTQEFSGTFDGGGHTISGVNIRNDGNAGFFFEISGEVKNLTLSGYVTGGGSYNHFHYIGGIASHVLQNGVIRNCTSLIRVINTDTAIGADECIGSIAGSNDGTVTGCRYLGLGGLYCERSIKAIASGNAIQNCTPLYPVDEGDEFVTIGSISGGGGTLGYFPEGSVLTMTLSAKEREGYALQGFMYKDKGQQINLTPVGGQEQTFTMVMPAQKVMIEGNYLFASLSGLGRDGQNRYLVSSVEDLKAVARAVRESDGCYDMTFLLTKDLENVGEFEGIAVGNQIGSGQYFYGTFDGGGHTISGMVIRSDTRDVGFIGTLAGTVKNLTLKDCAVINDNDNIYSNTGMIAGYASYSGTIINCRVLGGYVEGVWAGAIVGTDDVTLISENNYYDTQVCVFKDGIESAPGHSGTGRGDVSDRDIASVIWTVTFVDEDGVTELAAPQFVKNEEYAVFPMTLLQDPAAREHFTADTTRWRKTNGSEHSFENDAITGDVELTPMWTEEESYLVSFAPGEGGTGEMASVRVYVSDAAHYRLPRCFFTAPAGMAFGKWLYDGGEAAVGSEISFEGNITLTAQWSRPEYSVLIDDDARGEVTAEPETAHADDTVTLTAVPDEGYGLMALHVLDSAGQAIEVTNENGAWQFTMPAEDVIVNAVFFPNAFGTPDFSLPAGVGTIGNSAFEGVAGMTIVDAGNCTSIGKDAFKDCTNLTQIKLPAGCEIDPAAFDHEVYVFAPADGLTKQCCDAQSNLIFVELPAD